MRQSCFADPGHAFDQQMTVSQYRHHCQADDLILAANDFFEFSFQAGSPIRRGNHSFRGHEGDSTMWKRSSSGYLSDQVVSGQLSVTNGICMPFNPTEVSRDFPLSTILATNSALHGELCRPPRQPLDSFGNRRM